MARGTLLLVVSLKTPFAKPEFRIETTARALVK